MSVSKPEFIVFLGSHTPQGHVTAMPELIQTCPSLPLVNNPTYFQQYFQGGTVHSVPQSLPNASSGYSALHLQYQEECQCWANSAYKTPASSHAGSGQIPL